MWVQAKTSGGMETKRFGRFAIVFLALSVFALGLNAKLALYKPVSQTMLASFTKLATGDRPALVASLTAKRLAVKKHVGFEMFQELALGLELPAAAVPQAHYRSDVPVEARSAHKLYLCCKPPPASL
jgi:hypothetical protein